MDFPTSTGITKRHDIYPFIHPTKFTGLLHGKVVLLTGASKGIGRTTALALAASGASLALLARSDAELSSLVSEISSKYHTPTLALVGNILSNPIDTVARVERELGPISILINNAGKNHMVPFAAPEESLDEWWATFEVNVKGPIALMHAVLPHFIARGAGTFITVGSSLADVAAPYISAYCASKAAIVKACQILDMEFKELGIRSFIIHPGYVQTDMSSATGGSGKSQEMREMQEGYQALLTDTKELAAWSMVALAVCASCEVGAGGGDRRVEVLAGRYWDAGDDLGEILEQAEEIEKRDLYRLTFKKL